MDDRTRKTAAVLLAFSAGAAMDFLFIAVLKVIWFVVYGPAYFTAGIVLSHQLSRTRWKDCARLAVSSLVAGMVLSHLMFVGQHRTFTYSMSLSSESPITLRSSEWPQSLIVSSAELQKDLGLHPTPGQIPVIVTATADYGCIRSAPISTINGIDVLIDRDASWTWRNDTHADLAKTGGPGTEDFKFPWCQIQFYRSAAL